MGQSSSSGASGSPSKASTASSSTNSTAAATASASASDDPNADLVSVVAGCTADGTRFGLGADEPAFDTPCGITRLRDPTTNADLLLITEYGHSIRAFDLHTRQLTYFAGTGHYGRANGLARRPPRPTNPPAAAAAAAPAATAAAAPADPKAAVAPAAAVAAPAVLDDDEHGHDAADDEDDTVVVGDGDGKQQRRVAIARFARPCGISVNPVDRSVMITDEHCCRRIAGGVVSAVAGSATAGGWADGPGASSLFLYPSDIAFDSVGRAFITDFANSRLRLITPDTHSHAKQLAEAKRIAAHTTAHTGIRTQPLPPTGYRVMTVVGDGTHHNEDGAAYEPPPSDEPDDDDDEDGGAAHATTTTADTKQAPASPPAASHTSGSDSGNSGSGITIGFSSDDSPKSPASPPPPSTKKSAPAPVVDTVQRGRIQYPVAMVFDPTAAVAETALFVAGQGYVRRFTLPFDGALMLRHTLRPSGVMALLPAIPVDLWRIVAAYMATAGQLTTLTIDRELTVGGVTPTPSGVVLATCTATHSVYGIDPRTGNTELLAGAGGRGERGFAVAAHAVGHRLRDARFNTPYGIFAVEHERACYVCDSGNHLLKRIRLPDRLFQRR